MMNSSEEHLQYLTDLEAIRDIQARYCRGVDRLDLDLVRSCYHDGAIDHHEGYSGDPDGFIKWLEPALRGLVSCTHLTGNQMIRIKGDRAWVESFALVLSRRRDENGGLVDATVAMRYVDHVERRNGEWRIVERRMTIDSERIDPVENAGRKESMLPASQRSREDISYVVAASLGIDFALPGSCA